MKPSLLTLALISAFAAAPAYAADETQPENAAATNEASSEQSDQASQNLQNITVGAAPFAQKMGTQRITSRQIATRPHTNGTITDLLHDNPNVQFSNISGTSESAGEIAPENVSFHGEKFYNNNWQIDGMSNTDNSNPGAGAGYQNSNDSDMDGLPNGGAQSFWVNADIIDSVDVYDSNISAKYGQFTGGVVDAKLKDPSSKKASGSVSFRTSRSSWTRYHTETDVDAAKVQ